MDPCIVLGHMDPVAPQLFMSKWCSMQNLTALPLLVNPTTTSCKTWLCHCLLKRRFLNPMEVYFKLWTSGTSVIHVQMMLHAKFDCLAIAGFKGEHLFVCFFNQGLCKILNPMDPCTLFSTNSYWNFVQNINTLPLPVLKKTF